MTDTEVQRETLREIEEKIINGQNVAKTAAQYSFQLSNPTAKTLSN